MLLANARVTSV